MHKGDHRRLQGGGKYLVPGTETGFRETQGFEAEPEQPESQSLARSTQAV